jgi:hypothetical protein
MTKQAVYDDENDDGTEASAPEFLGSIACDESAE